VARKKKPSPILSFSNAVFLGCGAGAKNFAPYFSGQPAEASADNYRPWPTPRVGGGEDREEAFEHSIYAWPRYA